MPRTRSDIQTSPGQKPHSKNLKKQVFGAGRKTSDPIFMKRILIERTFKNTSNKSSKFWGCFSGFLNIGQETYPNFRFF